MSPDVSKNGPADPLEPDRYRFAEMVAAGEPITTVAAEFFITERTAYRWLKDERVRAVIHDIRAASLSSVAGQCQARLRRVMDRLDELVGSDDQRVSLSASRAVADLTLKLRAFEEYDDRLREIERRLGVGREEGAVA